MVCLHLHLEKGKCAKSVHACDVNGSQFCVTSMYRQQWQACGVKGMQSMHVSLLCMQMQQRLHHLGTTAKQMDCAKTSHHIHCTVVFGNGKNTFMTLGSRHKKITSTCTTALYYKRKGKNHATCSNRLMPSSWCKRSSCHSVISSSSLMTAHHALSAAKLLAHKVQVLERQRGLCCVFFINCLRSIIYHMECIHRLL